MYVSLTSLTTSGTGTSFLGATSTENLATVLLFRIKSGNLLNIFIMMMLPKNIENVILRLSRLIADGQILFTKCGNSVAPEFSHSPGCQ